MIVTCTTARAPFLDPRCVKPGTFIAAVGADSPEKSEIAPGADGAGAGRRRQCSINALEMGDLRHAVAAGAMTARSVHAELADLVTGRKPGRTSADEITLFDSTGTALQDVAAAASIYERAPHRARPAVRRTGRGRVNRADPAGRGGARLGQDRVSELRRPGRADRADAPRPGRGETLDLRGALPARAQLSACCCPGPEAQQLATYIGWLLHKTKGGLIAGALFVLPGFVAIMVLSWLYAALGNVDAVEALFFGLKAAVLAIVLEAVRRIGARALRNNACARSPAPPSSPSSSSRCLSPRSSSPRL